MQHKVRFYNSENVAAKLIKLITKWGEPKLTNWMTVHGQLKSFNCVIKNPTPTPTMETRKLDKIILGHKHVSKQF